MTELEGRPSRGRERLWTRREPSGPIRRFLRDRSGSTAIEYGLIMALIFLTIVTAMRLFADQTGAMYSYILTGLNRSS